MPFHVPTSTKSEAANRFEFEVAGVTYSVAHLKYAPAGAVEHFEQGRMVSGLILCADDEPTRDAIRSLDAEQLEAFTDAWRDASQVSPGESQASEGS
jgi:hypothetical protein